MWPATASWVLHTVAGRLAAFCINLYKMLFAVKIRRVEDRVHHCIEQGIGLNGIEKRNLKHIKLDGVGSVDNRASTD